MGKVDNVLPGTVGSDVVRVAEIREKRSSVIRTVREEIASSVEAYGYLDAREPLPDQYLNYKMPTYRNLSKQLGAGFTYYFVKEVIQSSDELFDAQKKYFEEISGKDYYRHTLGKLETILFRVLIEIDKKCASGIRLLTRDFEFRQAEMLNFLRDFLSESERSERSALASRFNHLKRDDTEIRKLILADAEMRLAKGEAKGSLYYCGLHKVNQGRVNRILREGLGPTDYAKRKSILAKRIFYPNSKDNDVCFSIVIDNLNKIIVNAELTFEQREDMVFRLTVAVNRLETRSF